MSPVNSTPPVLLEVTGNARLKRAYFETQLHGLLSAGEKEGGVLSDDEFTRLFLEGRRNLEAGGMLDVHDDDVAAAAATTAAWCSVTKNSTGQFVVSLDVKGREKGLVMLEARCSVQGSPTAGARDVSGETTLALRSPLGLGDKLSLTLEQGNQASSSLALWLPLAFRYLPPGLRFSSHGRLSATQSWETRAAVQSLSIKRTTLALEMLPTGAPASFLAIPSVSAGWELTDEVPCFHSPAALGISSARAGAHASASPMVLNACMSQSKWFLRATQRVWDSRQQQRGHEVGTSCSLTMELASRHIKPELDLLTTESAAGVYNRLSGWCLALLGGSRLGDAFRGSGWAHTARGSYWDDVLLEVAASAASIRPLPCGRACTRPPSFGDRLMLGGPGSIRGFDQCGLGARSFAPPREQSRTAQVTSSSSSSSRGAVSAALSTVASQAVSQLEQLGWAAGATGARGDALGGISKLALAPSLSFPLHLGRLVPADSWAAGVADVRAFAGLSVGWLESPYAWGHTKGRSYSSYLSVIGAEYRVSATVGLRVPVPSLQTSLSLTCSVPLRASGHDTTKPWQLSVGLLKL